MKILILFNLFIAYGFAQETVFESLNQYSPILYNHLNELTDTTVKDILNNNSHNITLLLPNTLSLNNSIQTGSLNLSDTQAANDAIRSLILDATVTSSECLKDRKYYTTYLNQTEISIGPSNTNPRAIEIYSGQTKAYISISNIQCSNGLIHIVDNFLQPAETPLKTISDLTQTNYMEELLKSLNISEVISKNNRTLLVPIDSAWTAINGTTLPFGKLLRDMRYMTFEGIYTSDQFNTTRNYTTGYRHTSLTIDSSLCVNNVSKIVETDILTSSGIIHLIDTVIEPPPTSKHDKNEDGSDTSNSSQEQQQTFTSNSCKIRSLTPLYLFIFCIHMILTRVI